MNYKKFANFFFELGMLKRRRHVGPLFAGVRDTESLADHTTRAALIGYFLAELEGANPERVALMLLLHDLPEIRTGDQDKVAARYYNTKPADKRAFKEQINFLPKDLQQRLWRLFIGQEERKDFDGIVAKDADWLEVAIDARERVCLGYKGMQDWIDNVRKALETESAKKILAEIEKGDLNDWYQGLKKMTFTKLTSKKQKNLGLSKAEGKKSKKQ